MDKSVHLETQLLEIKRERERLRELRRIDYMAKFSTQSDRDDWNNAEARLGDAALDMLMLLKKQEEIIEVSIDLIKQKTKFTWRITTSAEGT